MLRKKSPVTRPGIDPGTFRLVAETMIETTNSKFQAQCPNLRSDFVTITEILDSEFQAMTENITAKIQQENEKAF